MTFTCNECGQSFPRKFTLQRHGSRFHGIPMCSSKNSLYRCEETGCSVQVNTVQKLRDHLELQHGMEHPCQEETFSSLKEFLSWKATTEEETNSRWVSRSGAIKLKCGLSSQTMVCCRSGKKRFRGQGLRKLKAQGSRKIDRYCTSMMVVCQMDNVVQVTYFPTHYGHDDSLGHISLADRTRVEIAERLSQGEPVKKILSDVRLSDGDRLQRKHLVSSKDLHNIGKSFKVPVKLTRQKKQFTIDSIEDWISEMVAKKSVHFYMKDDGPRSLGMATDDFVLVIMTPIQKKIFLSRGHDRICVDSTGDSSECGGYELTTILAVDNFEEGVPVAFCVSSSVNEKVLKVFFQTVRKIVGKIECTVFMSDVVDIYYHVWTEVMGPPKHFLLCPWHVDRAWQEHLEDVADKEQRHEIYARLKACQVELDKSLFFNKFSELLETLDANTERHSLHEHLETFYIDRFELWAYSHRANLNINANMHVESFYRNLKHDYLMAKDSERVEEPVSVLNDYLSNKQFAILAKHHKGLIADKVVNVSTRHDDGMKIVSEVSSSGREYCWLVATSKTMRHVISMVTDHVCDAACPVRCDKCFVCLQGMTCSCHDNSIKGNLCEHIHATAIAKEEVIEMEEKLLDTDSDIVVEPTPGYRVRKDVFVEEVLYEDDNEEVVLFEEKPAEPEVEYRLGEDVIPQVDREDESYDKDEGPPLILVPACFEGEKDPLSTELCSTSPSVFVKQENEEVVIELGY